jgi:tetratricopeptide (TPR) repeat protein
MADVLAVFEQGKAAYDECDFAKALQCFAYAYEHRLTAQLDGLLDLYAEVACTLGKVELAKQLYEESVRAEPAAHLAKYFALAQLHEGQQALGLYTAGLDLLSVSLGQAEGAQATEINSQLAKGAAAVAELYMTDLW